MEVEREFSNCKEKVKHVLKNHEDARNNDDLLIWIIKHHIEDANLNNFNEYKETTTSETITRCRREIQNDDGELLPTDPEVIESRIEKEQKVRDYYMRKGDRETLRKYEKHLEEKRKEEQEDGVEKL